jgi:hypothetical protein
MTFEIVSTHSWNVLGTFDDELTAQQAVISSLREGGAGPEDLVVYVSDEAGEPVAEFSEDDLTQWVDAAGATASREPYPV